MTKITKKKTQKKATLEDLIKALDLDKKNAKCDSHAYGEVKSINQDGSYNVSLNGSQTTVKCARLVGAAVGDTVFVTILKNGFAVVTDCLGGDKDALKIAEHFWTDSEGAHVTQVPQEDYEDDPENAGGNVLIKSIGMLIRDGLTNLLQVLSTGITIGPESGYHLTLSANSITFQDGDLPPFTISFDAQDREAMFEGPRFMQNVVSRIIIRDNQESLQTSANDGNNHYNLGVVGTYADNFGCSADIHASTGSNRFAQVYVGAWDDTQESYVDLIGDEIRFDGDPLFKTFTATGTVSINSNTGNNVSVTGNVPTGYTPIAVQEISSDHNYTCLIGKFELISNGASISLRNMSSSDYNNMNVTATILCAKV